MSKKILYLHGFASSPASWKVQLPASALAQRGLGERLHCPALSPVPVEAIAQAEAIINQQGRELTLIGSSLGGFYATWLAEKHDLPAVLINPAHYWLLVETGDEVLDYRVAVERYAGCRQSVLEGGDHSFTRFPEMLPQLIEYCGL